MNAYTEALLVSHGAVHANNITVNACRVMRDASNATAYASNVR